MHASRVFVLLHSPFVGPYTWSLVAEGLCARTCEVVVSTFPEAEGCAALAWHQYAARTSSRAPLTTASPYR
jgi:hypothetical protein